MGIFQDFNSGFDTEQRLAHASIVAQNQGYNLSYIKRFDKYNTLGYLTYVAIFKLISQTQFNSCFNVHANSIHRQMMLYLEADTGGVL